MTWFDSPENQRNEHLHDFGTTSIGDLGKCSGNYQMVLPRTSEINVRVHVPRGRAKQCPVVIATSRQFAISRKVERRSSDSRINNFVEIDAYSHKENHVTWQCDMKSCMEWFFAKVNSYLDQGTEAQ